MAAAPLLLCAVFALPAVAAEIDLRTLRIETEPPGAEVLLIGGVAGYTPLSIGERALYPNDYSDEQAKLYGTVTLRRAGCVTVVHRVTLDDIARGLHVALDCGVPSSVGVASGLETSTAPAEAPSARGPATREAVSQRRLRQLQVLQELLDEGLIDAEQERHIRRRLLEAR